MPDNSSPRDRQEVLDLLRRSMVEKKLTQAQLADLADCHEKTVQNLFAGHNVRDQTLFDVCIVLGVEYTAVKDAWLGQSSTPSSSPSTAGRGGHVAPVYMGAYTREAVEDYVGSYLTLRPSFSEAGILVAYRTEISWDAEWPSLVFEEHDRPDAHYQHRGRVYVSATSNFIHLVSLTKGAMRMIMISQMDQNGQMRGLITTLNRQGPRVVPVSAPIVYARKTRHAPGDLGEIASAHARYAEYHALLRETVEQSYARLVGGPL